MARKGSRQGQVAALLERSTIAAFLRKWGANVRREAAGAPRDESGRASLFSYAGLLERDGVDLESVADALEAAAEQVSEGAHWRE